MPIQDSDLLIVGRGDTSHKITYNDLKLALINDGLNLGIIDGEYPDSTMSQIIDGGNA